MTKKIKNTTGLFLQLGLIATGVSALAPAPAQAILTCTINADAKGIPFYDKPGGAEVRRADADPAWKAGAAQPAHEKGNDGMMEMWIEVHDASGASVGFVKVGDGGAGCSGSF